VFSTNGVSSIGAQASLVSYSDKDDRSPSSDLEIRDMKRGKVAKQNLDYADERG
jgi:hypothetical protein